MRWGLIVFLQSEAARLAEEVSKREKHITVLFSNAGYALPIASSKHFYSTADTRITGGHVSKPNVANASTMKKAYFDDVPEEAFSHVYSTNAVASYWLTFAFLPLLEKWKESPCAAKFAPQVIVTSSMNGWTKVC